MLAVVTIETPALGDRSYLIHDEGAAVVIDPQRDIGRVLAAAESRRVQITHVLETHIHNDYVTGGLVLAKHVRSTSSRPPRRSASGARASVTWTRSTPDP